MSLPCSSLLTRSGTHWIGLKWWWVPFPTGPFRWTTNLGGLLQVLQVKGNCQSLRLVVNSFSSERPVKSFTSGSGPGRFTEPVIGGVTLRDIQGQDYKISIWMFQLKSIRRFFSQRDVTSLFWPVLTANHFKAFYTYKYQELDNQF